MKMSEDEIIRTILDLLSEDFPKYRFIVYPKNIGKQQTIKKKTIKM